MGAANPSRQRHCLFTYTTSAQVYVNHQTAPSPVGEGWGGGSKRHTVRHCPFTYTMSAQMYVNHQTAPSPRGGGLGWGSLANLETPPSLAGRSPQWGKVQTGETACIRSRLSFGASRCLRRKRQLNELRKAPLPRGGGLERGQRTLAARHGPFTYTMSAQVYVNLTLSLAGRASVRSGKGVSDRIDESKFRFLNGLLPPTPTLPHGGGSRAAKWRAFVPAFRSALPIVCD